ncbi:autophagy protein 5 [Aaosphaeria arxii CBS 175.79]|uniref:Autophagy protein 5 n=1 Tax=Aaosphaeria arxii CBS 175.79 TaxID=1450172 RepID=A0A6A5XR85_9PLEO|nr:autophagy protein 5 [Aaosphaeria arxii CBS 175.79]KAF2015692.1 autophagy protein 5 [Aaosphaeria arxii CBS 175.79]
MSSSRDVTSRLRQTIWNGSLPLEIRLHKGDCRTYDDSDPYLIQYPRLSYLGLLIHRLRAFFSNKLIYPDVDVTDLWLEHEGVPLKWHYPLGLLYDLYSGNEPAYPNDATSSKVDTAADDQVNLPWRLTVHFSDYPVEHLVKLDADGKHLYDMFINSAKEADYLRNGTGRTVMSLSKEDSTQLWDSVQQHDFSLFGPINQKLLNPQGVNLRHIPIKLYLPHATSSSKADAAAKSKDKAPGSLRVVQALVTPALSSRQPQTVGTALNQIIPSLFPSRRSPLLAQAVLHGAVLPLASSVEDLLRVAAYMDGWMHIAVIMMA